MKVEETRTQKGSSCLLVTVKFQGWWDMRFGIVGRFLDVGESVGERSLKESEIHL